MAAADTGAFLRTIIRSIDKKTDFKLQPANREGRSGLIVELSQGTRSTSVEISDVELAAGLDDASRRHQLRSKIKRAHDRMWTSTTAISSTKLMRPTSEGMSFFRSANSGGGGGGRGRR